MHTPTTPEFGRRNRAGINKILVMGNLGGRAHGSGNSQLDRLSNRVVHRVDFDELDEVINRIAPELTLDLPDGPAVQFAIRELDDFHPDQLYDELNLFEELGDLRKQLHDSASYVAATQRLQQLVQKNGLPAEDKGPLETPAPSAVENDAATFERLLGRPGAAQEPTATARDSAIDRLIEQVVGDVAVPAADPNRQLYYDAADELIGNLMREVLHHPRFQALESLWRSIEFLVDRLELDEELQLFVLDVTKEELIEDLSAADNQPEQTELFKLLVDQGVQIPGTEPWSLLIGDFRFGPSEQDVGLLSSLGSVASQAGGPFLAAAKPTVLGCNSVLDLPDPRNWGGLEGETQRRWQALRQSSAAHWIGLALPRLLLRLPYGANTDEIEAFSFTEAPKVGENHGLLWGNPAFGCAFLIGQAFTQGGWTTGASGLLDIGDLPAYSYRENGESKLTPCAEFFLSEKTGEAMLASGLIPVLSRRNSNSVRVLNLPSLSDPVCSLPTFAN